jgi:hypothetical protein
LTNPAPCHSLTRTIGKQLPEVFDNPINLLFSETVEGDTEELDVLVDVGDEAEFHFVVE